MRDWRNQNWFVIALAAFGVLCSLFLAESPRWLISQKRFTQARLVLEQMAKTNGKQLKSEIDCQQDVKDVKENKNTSIKASFREMLGTRERLFKFLLLTTLWFALNLLYYGVSLGVTSIDSVNPYLIYLFSSLAEFCGYMLCSINDIYGRKRMSIIYFLLSGIFCLVISFVPRNTDPNDAEKVLLDAIIIISLASLGKCAASAAFNTCVVVTADHYPTNIRGFAVLSISCLGSVGSLVSPQVNLSRVLWKSLPYIIFSIFSLVGSVAMFFLPDVADFSNKVKPIS